MNSIVANWKTSVAGVALIALAGLGVVGVHVPGIDTTNTTVLLTTAFGLLVAHDGKAD